MNTKLSLLVRDNKGGKLFSELQPQLELLLSARIISRASLIDTDRIIQMQKTAYGNAVLSKAGTVRRIISRRESSYIGALLRCFGDLIQEEAVYYTPKQSEYVGALEVPIRAALAHFQDLINFDGDSLQITSKNERNGLFLDWNRDDEAAQFEFVTWGEEWSNAASACLQSTVGGLND